jgi:hypothetical protein
MYKELGFEEERGGLIKDYYEGGGDARRMVLEDLGVNFKGFKVSEEVVVEGGLVRLTLLKK